MPDNDKIVTAYNQIEDVFIDGRDFDIVVSDMIRIINAPGVKYREQATKRDLAPYRVRIFHASKTEDPTWKDFIEGFVNPDQPITGGKNTTQSFLLFVGYKKRIFAITGGAGSFAVQRFLSQSFGMDILSRLINESTPAIKSIQNRGVTGTILAQAKHFRKDRRLIDENEFGQIYKEVKADLDVEILTRIFGFKESELTRNISGCLANSSFKLNKRVNPDGFLTIISRLDALLNQPPNFKINSVELISRKKSGQLIKRLEDELTEIIYKTYKNGEELDFDFLHPETDKYFKAAYFETTQGRFTSPPVMQELLMELAADGILKTGDVQEFKKSIMKIMLNSHDENGTLLTSGSLWDHIHGEINLDKRTFFYLDGEWYRIKPHFVDELNKELKLLLDQHWDETLITTPFDLSKDEAAFNLSFIDMPGMLVFDKIVPDNIEPCDLLKHAPNNINLIHVKKGINMMRDLVAQVSISATRIQQDRKVGYKYINEIERKVKAAATSDSAERKKLSVQVFPPGGLVKLFKNTRPSNICFCLAFVDNAKTKRNLKDDLTSFNSNIAKYSLLTLIKEVVKMGFDFKVIQLNKKEVPPKRPAGKKVVVKKVIIK